MIIISLLGVDQYQAQDFVRDVHAQVAQIFETDPEEILFYAPDSFLIYKGVEQTSYHLNIVVQAPEKYQVLENKAADCLIKLFSQNHVHVRVLFEYFNEEREHQYYNEEYPRYMTEDNMASFETEPEDTEPYMGNAFEGYQDRIDQKEKEQLAAERERIAKESESK